MQYLIIFMRMDYTSGMFFQQETYSFTYYVLQASTNVKNQKSINILMTFLYVHLRILNLAPISYL